jgi:segregation and condensation protein B
MTRPDALVRAVEAVLFAADAPLTLDAIRAHVGAIATARDVRAAIEVLVEDYTGSRPRPTLPMCCVASPKSRGG